MKATLLLLYIYIGMFNVDAYKHVSVHLQIFVHLGLLAYIYLYVIETCIIKRWF